MSREMRLVVLGALIGTAVAIVLWMVISVTIYGWVLLGSTGALAGSPEDTSAALSLFRAIRKLGVPVLLIDHISKGAIKGDDPDMAFGSAYTEYQARLAWKVTSEWHPGEMVMRLKNTKANNGPKRPEMNVRFTFDEDRVLISSNGALAQPRPADTLPDPFETRRDLM